MNTEEKIELIKKNTEEIITLKELEELLSSNKKISAYNGAATTGPYHIGYMIPLSKMFDFNKAGITTKILLANIHAALDDLKAPWDEIDKRAEYYSKCIEMSLPWEKKPEIVKGSDFQLKKEYQIDVLKAATISTVGRATRAASEVTRMKNPKVSELIYPIMQALDEQYLDVDIQLGGTDQRHIMAFARETLPALGYKQRIEIMTPLVASLKGPGTKMSSSDPKSHIKVYDSEKQIEEKMKNAYCPVGELENNPVTQICQFIVFPLKEKINIERPEKFGGDVSFASYEDLAKAFTAKQIHPNDLKPAVAKELKDIFKKPRDYFDENQDLLKDLGKEFIA